MRTQCNERGQVTIALAGILVIGLLVSVALAMIGDAMIHRARARTGADAVALAAAVSIEDAADLQAWYETQGVRVQLENHGQRVSAYATSGPSQAKAWAGVTAASVETSPALRAIVARVEQLRGRSMTTVSWQGASVVLQGEDAAVMRSMQAEFRLCSSGSDAAGWRFESC